VKLRRRLISLGIVTLTAAGACVGIEHLSTTQQAAVVIGPTTITFPDTDVGTTNTLPFTVAPASGSGSSNDTITLISFNCADFSVGGPSLPTEVFRRCDLPQAKRNGDPAPSVPEEPVAGFGTGSQIETCFEIVQSATFPVSFTPKNAGSQSCQITLKGTFGTSIVAVAGRGVLLKDQIAVSPGGIDFGDVRRSQPSGNVSIEIKNVGSTPLQIANVMGFGGAYNVAGNTGTHTIPVGGQELLLVTCTPPDVGSITTNLVINSSATNKPQVTIPLACKGIDSALATDPGSPIDLDTRVDELITRSIKITNTGNAVSTIEQISIVDTTEVVLANPPAPGTLLAANGGNLDVLITYAPTVEQSKVSVGKLRIQHDGNKQDDLVISVQALATTLGANPDGADFGPVCVGATKTMPLQIFATDAGAFMVTSITLPAAPFSFIGTVGGIAIGNHDNNLDFEATVSPVAPGMQTAVVTVGTNIPNEPSRDFVLSVEGLVEGVGTFPTAVDFGPVDLDQTTLFKSVKLTNCATRPLMVTSARIEGDAAADFQFVGVAGDQPLARTLQPTETEEFLVIMSPKLALGTRTASLVIVHSEGETPTRLDGTAIGELPEEPEVRGPETYYQCNSGGNGGVLVGLTIFGLAVRRRRKR